MPAVSVSPAAAPLVFGKARHGGIDALRLAAVVGIVFYHAGRLPALPALAGMHALIVAAIVFASTSQGSGSAGSLVARRAARLLLPWLFFAVLYLVVPVRTHRTQPWMFLIGGSLHLWFVPFIFVATCAVALESRSHALPRSWARAAAWAVLAVLLMHVEARLTPRIARAVPLLQFLDGTTGVVAAMTMLSLPARGPIMALAAAAGLAVLGACVWLPWRTAGMMTVPPMPLGLLTFVGVTAVPVAANAVTDFAGRTAFGLYLMHPLVLHALERVYAGFRHVPADQIRGAGIAGCAALTVVLCLAMISVLERTALRRLVI